MKYVFIFLLLLSCVSASVFTADSIDAQIDVSSKLETKGHISTLTADILFFPIPDKSLLIKSLDTDGNELPNRLSFRWNNPSGVLDFGYSAVINNKNLHNRVKSKILFPNNFGGMDKFVRPSPNIDSDHPQIKLLSEEFSNDDMFILVGEVARWVNSNVQYNLSTLTADVSRPASWVLQNRKGVCDEITSLFIAVLRSLGIPARFVSGVAFTNSPNFPTGWGAHGWAEVYFPGVGWIPYDPTFGQLGWVDPGHIKLKESLDPQESTVVVEWTGSSADVVVHDLDIDTNLLNTYGSVKNPVMWSVGSIHSNVGFGSSNVVIADIENTADYYVAGELSLAKVSELDIPNPSKLFILRPNERSRVFWKVFVNDDLDSSFQYEIPLVVYDIANFSQRSSFAVTSNDVSYSEEEADSYIARESSTTPPPVELACVLDNDALLPGEKTTVRCRAQNHLESSLKGSLCYLDSCKDVDISPNSFVEESFSVNPTIKGANDVKVSFSSDGYSANSLVTVILLDPPSVSVTDINVPDSVHYGESFDIKFTVKKTSLSHPRDVFVFVEGGGANVEMPLGNLVFDQDVVINVDSSQLYGGSPVFDILVKFEDEAGNVFEQSSIASTSIVGVPWYKSIVGWFMNLF